MFPVNRLQAAVASFAGRSVVIVGDLIADEYLYGKPARISREAPVLILKFTDREVRLGGAANATHNVHALGARALPVGVLGADGPGGEVKGLYSVNISTGMGGIFLYAPTAEGLKRNPDCF